MPTDSVTVRDPSGLHARSARELVDLVDDYDATIRLSHDGVEAEADSIMEIMMLAASPGATLTVAAEGPEADDALEALRDFFEEDSSSHEPDV